MSEPKVIDIDGLTLIYHFTDVNNEFCLMPYFKTGAITESDKNCGVTHFLEHMLGKQTTSLTEQDTLEILKLYMPKYNAATGYQYMFMIANTSVRHMEKVFAFVGDVIQNSVFTDERTKKESKVIEQEICKYEIDNVSVASDNLFRIFYNYPAFNNEILGTKQKVLSYLGADIKARFSELATKQNMVLSFAGNASEEKVVELVKKYFANVPSNEQTTINPPDIQINGEQKVVVKTKKEDNTITGVVGTNCNFNKQDKRERVMLNLLKNYLNAQGQPLWNDLREKKTLVYQFFADCSTIVNTSIMQFFFQTTKKNIADCISCYGEVTRSLAKSGLGEQDFEDLKESLRILIDGQVNLCVNACERNANNFVQGFDFYNRTATLNLIDSITLSEFNAFLKRFFATTFVGASFVGNIAEKDVPTLNQLKEQLCN